MQKNPIYKPARMIPLTYRPLRNYLCPHYDECMDRAAMENVNLYCKDCPYRDTQIEEFTLSTLEINACINLVQAVFCEYRHRGRVICNTNL